MNLGSLAGGIVQGIPEGVQLQQVQQQNQGLTDFGNALATAYGGQGAPQQTGPGGPLGSIMSALQGGGQQLQAAQQFSMPQPAPPQQAMPQTGGQGGAPQGGMQVPVPQAPAQQAPPPMPQQVQPGGGVQRAPPPIGQGAQQQAQPSPQPPPQQQAQPQPPPQPPQQQGPQGGQPPSGMLGQLDLPTLVRNLVKNGVTGRRLGESVQRFIPLLNAQGLQQYRAIQGQLAPIRVENQIEDTQSKIADRKDRSQDRKKAEGDRMDIARQRMEGITQRFDQEIQLKTQQLQSTNDRAAAGRLAQDVRAAIRAKQTATQHEINASQSLDPDSKTALQAQAKADADEASKQLDEALKSQRDFKPGAAQGGDQPPRQDQADTAYGPDGKQVRWNGKQPKSDPQNWVPLVGQQ